MPHCRWCNSYGCCSTTNAKATWARVPSGVQIPKRADEKAAQLQPRLVLQVLLYHRRRQRGTSPLVFGKIEPAGPQEIHKNKRDFEISVLPQAPHHLLQPQRPAGIWLERKRACHHTAAPHAFLRMRPTAAHLRLPMPLKSFGAVGYLWPLLHSRVQRMYSKPSGIRWPEWARHHRPPDLTIRPY